MEGNDERSIEMSQAAPYRDTQRVIARLIIHFVLRTIRGLSDSIDGDFKKSVIFFALSNTQGRMDAGRCEVRPISAQAVATSLCIPTETVRRILVEFVDRKLCARGGRMGWSVAENSLAQGLVSLQRTRVGKEFVRMLNEIAAIGFDFRSLDNSAWPRANPSAPVFGSDEHLALEPPAAIEAVASGFFLRLIESGMGPHKKSLERAIVFVAIMAGNTERISYDPEIAWAYPALDTLPPDSLRRAVTVLEASQVLGMPYETTRRYVNALLRDGHCVRAKDKGVFIPAQVNLRPEFLEMNSLWSLRFAQAVAELRRMKFDFSSLGSPRIDQQRSEAAREVIGSGATRGS